MIRVLQASAHDLSGVEDGSVQLIATSPPYYGLRSYAGDQDVEWPTVVFRLNEWTEPVTVQGCEPGCQHEWVSGPMVDIGRRDGEDRAKIDGYARDIPGKRGTGTEKASQDRYCRHCGGWRGPLGLEPSPAAYIGHLILCLREWRRVLRDDGICFVNLGDSFASHGGNREYGSSDKGNGRAPAVAGIRLPTYGIKAKDLMMIPAMFAMAARADGWYLRSEIIWAKGVSFLTDYAGSVMPESVEDRPTRAHEQVFMLTKSPRYFYDNDAVREASTGQNGAAANFKRTTKEHLAPNQAATQHRDDRKATTDNGSRNLRDVWVITPQPYKAAHYAVFPEKLVAPMIRCATSERGACPTCGAPWKRVVERTAMVIDRSHNHPSELRTRTSGTMVEPAKAIAIGWLPTCACYGIPPMPEYPDEPEKPGDIDDGAPETCVKCEGLGYLPSLPMFPDDRLTCPKCDGAGGKEATPEWLAWRAEQDAWQAERERIMEEEIKPFLSAAQDLPTVPCIVMDPFSGSGTTAGVALKLGREAVAIDISAEYLREHVPERTTVQMEVPLL